MFGAWQRLVQLCPWGCVIEPNSSPAGQSTGSLSRDVCLALLGQLFSVREADLCEQHLIRQGRGWIHIPGQGHEAMAAIAQYLREGDLVFPYYRDRALIQGRGVTPLEMAHDYLATASSSSGGRSMPVHGSWRRLGIFPPATPTGAQCLPAAGAAWGIKMRGAHAVVVCTIGDAASRQGEFYEAVAFAMQECLPIVYVVEDNGFGISTRTDRLQPFRLGLFSSRTFVNVDGSDVFAMAQATKTAIECARRGGGPSILVASFDRLTSHTNSDDHRIYRSDEEIRNMQLRDPIRLFVEKLMTENVCSEKEIARIELTTIEQVRAAYLQAEVASDPDPASVLAHAAHESSGMGPPISVEHRIDAPTMVDALNLALAQGLARDPCAIVLGEDVEDPKGGVFGFTRGLSSRFPGRVINAPLAEATILGTAVGLAATGFRPICEIQFIDFLAPAFNQLITQVSTLAWRSNGDWQCPLLIYAPYGAYLPAGGIWHSQSNDGIWTHIPGLRVAVPSHPADVASLASIALTSLSPTLLLIPKHVMRVRHQAGGSVAAFGEAKVLSEGTDVTVVAWGNCVELALEAAHQRRGRCSIEVIDLVSLAPCDWGTIERSVSKTGRLVVVTEDVRTTSFGQAVVAEMVGSQSRFSQLLSPPLLVSRPDCHIPFHPVLESALLPNVSRIQHAITEVMR